MHARRIGAVSLAIAVPFVAALFAADPPITSDQAKDHVGKRVTVCGDVVSTGKALAKGQGGKQKFLHFDQAPPHSPFTAVIIGGDLAGGGVFFGIEKKVEHKHVCVTGYVQDHDGTLIMRIDAPNQLKVMGDAKQ